MRRFGWTEADGHWIDRRSLEDQLLVSALSPTCCLEKTLRTCYLIAHGPIAGRRLASRPAIARNSGAGDMHPIRATVSFVSAMIVLLAQPVFAGGSNATPPAATPPAQQVAMPDAEAIVVLARTTLLTLDDALKTGNFTVLRDIAAPGFRDANSAARLSHIFANLESQHVDLSTVAITAPQLAEAPTIDPQSGMLQIKGHFPLAAARIDFGLLFQPAGGRWKLFGISVQPSPPAVATGVGPAAAPPLAGKAAGAEGKAPAEKKGQK
jgi:hypothetical protein